MKKRIAEMKIRVIDSNGIARISIRDLARAGKRSRNDDLRPPLLWTPEDSGNGSDDFYIPPPEGHDPKGRNRR